MKMHYIRKNCLGENLHVTHNCLPKNVFIRRHIHSNAKEFPWYFFFKRQFANYCRNVENRIEDWENEKPREPKLTDFSILTLQRPLPCCIANEPCWTPTECSLYWKQPLVAFWGNALKQELKRGEMLFAPIAARDGRKCVYTGIHGAVGARILCHAVQDIVSCIHNG